MCESDSHVLTVEDRVEATDEHVSQNPERSVGGGDIKSHESGDTHAHSLQEHRNDHLGTKRQMTLLLSGEERYLIGDLEDVVLALEGEVLTSNGEGDWGKVGDSVAVNLVLAVHNGESSDLLLDLKWNP